MAPDDNGQEPAIKLAQTLPCAPNGHGNQDPLTKAVTLARAVVAATADLKVNTISAAEFRRTVQNSALQLGTRTDVGLDSPPPPES